MMTIVDNTFSKFENGKRWWKIKQAVGNFIVLTMIGISNSNKTSYQDGCQSRTNACI